MNSRRKLGWMLGGGVVLVFGLLVLDAMRQAPGRGQWLRASNPVFSLRTNAEGIHLSIVLLVSNVSSASIGFWVPWSERRTSPELDLVPTKLVSAGGTSRAIPLRPGAATAVVIEMLGARATNSHCLFCGELGWAEAESRLRRWAHRVDRPMYWLGAVFGFNWNPSWQRKSLAGGAVFTSNSNVADYFGRVYGFTRQKWLEEEQVERERQAALARKRAVLPPGHSLGGFYRGTGELVQDGHLRAEAKTAFIRFCRTSAD